MTRASSALMAKNGLPHGLVAVFAALFFVLSVEARRCSLGSYYDATTRMCSECPVRSVCLDTDCLHLANTRSHGLP